jgi:hypothetical protein
MATTRRRTARRLPMPHTEVEFLILADRAEVLNGKLYMMGGAWDHMFVSNIDQPVGVNLACCALVPYLETDDDHTLQISIRDPDGVEVHPTLSVSFKTGRPPTLERGAGTRVPFAVGARIKFPKYDAYTITATVDSRPDSSRHLAFYIKEPGAASGRAHAQ